MTTIGLIRHGITEWNSLGKLQGISDVPLNEVGKMQAIKIGERLSREENWDMIITSDLSRAIKTAQIIGNKINLPISHVDKRIREINFGKIEGTTKEERVNQWGSKWRDLDFGMEKFEDVSKRGIDFLVEMVRIYNGTRILLVSHGALIGLTLEKLLPDKFQKTRIANASITILNFSKGEWDCILYNCTKHLK